MSRLATLLEERVESLRADWDDPDRPYTRELGVSQFVYEMVSDFIERDEYRIVDDLLDDDYDLDAALTDWIEAI